MVTPDDAAELLSCDGTVIDELMRSEQHPPIIWGRYFELRTLVAWAADHVKQIWGRKHDRLQPSKRPRIYLVELPGIDTKGPPPLPTTLDLLTQMEGAPLHLITLENKKRRVQPYSTRAEDDRRAARKNIAGRPWLDVDPDRYKVRL